MKVLDKIIGPDYKKNLYFFLQIKVFRLCGYLFEAVMLSSVVGLIVGFTCMFFTKNEVIINAIPAFFFISLLLGSYKRSKSDFLAFEKRLKNAILKDKDKKIKGEKL